MQIINLLTSRFTGCHSFTFWRENKTGKGVAGCHRMSPIGVVDADTQIKEKEKERYKGMESTKPRTSRLQKTAYADLPGEQL